MSPRPHLSDLLTLVFRFASAGRSRKGASFPEAPVRREPLGDGHDPFGPRRRRLASHYRRLALNTLQAWLCLAFMAAASTKAVSTRDGLDRLLGWTALVDRSLVTAAFGIEAATALGFAVGLVSLSLRRVVMGPTFVVALGITLFYFAVHVSRAEADLAFLNLVLAAMVVVLGGGRLSSSPAVLARRG